MRFELDKANIENIKDKFRSKCLTEFALKVIRHELAHWHKVGYDFNEDEVVDELLEFTKDQIVGRVERRTK